MQSWEQLFHFFGLRGFKVIDQNFSPQAFGNFYYTFSNGQIVFQIIQDRSQMILEVGFAKDNDEWFSISLIQAFLQNKMNIEISNSIDSKVLFLMENFNIIVEMFSEKNYQKSKQKLNEHHKKSSYHYPWQ